MSFELSDLTNPVYCPHTHTRTYSCEVDLSSISPEVTHDLTLSLKGSNGEDAGSIHVLLVITGTSVEEEDGEGEVQASLRREVNMKEAETKYVSSRRGGRGGRKERRGEKEGREGEVMGI